MQRAVAVFPGALGDLLLALPALRALRARHAHVTLVVNQWLRPLAEMADVADETAALDAAEAAGLFGGDALPSWLAGRPVVYSWLGGGDEALGARVTAAAAAARFFRVERGPGREHAAAAYARAVGARATPRALAAAATLSAPLSARAIALLAALGGRPVLAVHAGAGARARRWDVAGFVQVAHWWRATGGAVVAIAGPAEAGEPPALGPPEAREWPLADLAALLGGVALYLGNDSGVSHLAGAVGARGVVLFGPTDPRRWKPVAGRLVALRARAGGAEGMTLGALPSARVVAACRRRVALTRTTPETSVPTWKGLPRAGAK